MDGPLLVMVVVFYFYVVLSLKEIEIYQTLDNCIPYLIATLEFAYLFSSK